MASLHPAETGDVSGKKVKFVEPLASSNQVFRLGSTWRLGNVTLSPSISERDRLRQESDSDLFTMGFFVALSGRTPQNDSPSPSFRVETHDLEKPEVLDLHITRRQCPEYGSDCR